MHLPASIVLLVPLLTITHGSKDPGVEPEPSSKGKESPVGQPTQATTKSYKVTDVVFFDIEIGGTGIGRIKIGLFRDVVPKTVKNFVSFASGYNYKGGYYQEYGYKVPFHRIVPGFMMQGGDVVSRNGKGRTSIYGDKFDDENFELKHAGPGYVGMANSGPNSNGCQFYITFKATPWLDNKHVVFGKVIQGMDIIRQAEGKGTSSGSPAQAVLIVASGSLYQRGPPMFLQNDEEGTVVTNQ